METVNFVDFHDHLKQFMRKVNLNSAPILVIPSGAQDSIVVMGQHDYEATQETMQIMSNQYLIQKIDAGDRQFKAGIESIRGLHKLEDGSSGD